MTSIRLCPKRRLDYNNKGSKSLTSSQQSYDENFNNLSWKIPTRLSRVKSTNAKLSITISILIFTKTEPFSRMYFRVIFSIRESHNRPKSTCAKGAKTGSGVHRKVQLQRETGVQFICSFVCMRILHRKNAKRNNVRLIPGTSRSTEFDLCWKARNRKFDSPFGECRFPPTFRLIETFDGNPRCICTYEWVYIYKILKWLKFAGSITNTSSTEWNFNSVLSD